MQIKLLVRLLLLWLSLPAFAANVYICPGATGANTGADWTNAYTGINTSGQLTPGNVNLVRGNTYYVASGDPFTNVNDNLANANNFLLTGASDPTSARFDTTSACATIASTNGSCTNTDLFGNSYTSSRGALQFNGSGPTVTPAPALGMFAWDWDPLEGIAP